jgi:hypothetical protein
MSLLALGVVFSITFGMWLRFAIWDYTTTQQIPASVRPELEELRADQLQSSSIVGAISTLL